MNDFAGPIFPVAGVAAYSPSATGLGTRAPVLADKILRGAKPGDLPIEQPTKYSLTINLKMANASA